MSVRESRSRRRWLSDLLIAKVRVLFHASESFRTTLIYGSSDANLFKEAFEKAQQDNEALFPKESAAAAPEATEKTE